MRILLLNQFFWPDSAATSQLLTDVARELASRGHEVHAICSQSGYALEDSSNQPDVHIHRVRSLPFLRGAAGRLASYASFYLSSAWKTLRLPRPDVVLTLTTPPLLSLLGTFAKTLRGSRHFIWEMDMYPDVAVDLGYFAANGVLDRIVGVLADLSRHQADGVLALGSCMRDRISRRGTSPEKIVITENWADSTQIQPVEWPNETAPLTVLYSGNFGLAHDAETIQAAMKSLGGNENFRFVFAGGGARRKPLENYCAERQIPNVEFRDYSSKTNLAKSLGAGHIGLITQQTACLGSVVPSKVYGLLAAGRPILYIGPRESTVAGLVKRFQCGWQIDCADHVGLVSLLQKLEGERSEVQKAGIRARLALLEHYDLPHGVNRVCMAIGAAQILPARPKNSASESGSTFAEERQSANRLKSAIGGKLC